MGKIKRVNNVFYVGKCGILGDYLFGRRGTALTFVVPPVRQFSAQTETPLVRWKMPGISQ